MGDSLKVLLNRYPTFSGCTSAEPLILRRCKDSNIIWMNNSFWEKLLLFRLCKNKKWHALHSECHQNYRKILWYYLNALPKKTIPITITKTHINITKKNEWLPCCTLAGSVVFVVCVWLVCWLTVLSLEWKLATTLFFGFNLGFTSFCVISPTLSLKLQSS